MNPTICQSALDAFHELDSEEQQILQGVFERVEDGCRDLIALRFSSGTLFFRAEADDDTIEVRYQESDTPDLVGFLCVDALLPWSPVIGRPFGWGWLTINQQGYQDGVLLSFGGIEPSILLLVASSSLCVRTIKEETI